MEFNTDTIQQYAGDRSFDADVAAEQLRRRYAALRTRAAESEEAAAARHQIAERTLDLTEEYFPAEVAARRRRIAAMGFAAGFVVRRTRRRGAAPISPFSGSVPSPVRFSPPAPETGHDRRSVHRRGEVDRPSTVRGRPTASRG